MSEAGETLSDAAPRSLEGVGGCVPAPQVRALCDELDVGIETLMLRLLPVAANFATVPISSFRVGAVALGNTASGEDFAALYLGANVEFTGQALGFSVHAEQSAVLNAWQHGEHGVSAIATSAAPCGHCRQFLHEIVDSDHLRVLEPSDGDGEAHQVATLSELLPHAFGAQDLGVDGGLLDRSFEDSTLSLPPAAGTEDPLLQEALDAARKSYVPYTGGRAGCAIQIAAGTIFTGRYAESAAYNPSVSPLEAAVAFQVMNRPQGAPFEIARAVLVESPSSAGQRGATEAVLSSIAPGVALEYHVAQ